jgi:hypothetical protein
VLMQDGAQLLELDVGVGAKAAGRCKGQHGCGTLCPPPARVHLLFAILNKSLWELFVI